MESEPVNIKLLAEEVGIDEKDYIELLELFVTTVTAEIQRIKASYQQKDFKAIMASAHSIKGSSINMGIVDIHKLSRRLESDAKEGNLSLMPQLIEEIEIQTNIVSNQLAAYC